MFVAVNLFAVIQTYVISLALVEWLFPLLRITWYTYELAHFVGISVPIITSYIGHKYLTFRPENPLKGSTNN